jgi:hypothetical protein
MICDVHDLYTSVAYKADKPFHLPARSHMPFQGLGELFCMPAIFGERHALRAWGSCNNETEKYSIGQPKALPQASLKQTNIGLQNAMSGNGWGFNQPLLVSLSPCMICLALESVA